MEQERDVAEAQRQRKQLLLEQTVGVDRGKRPFELLASATAIQRESAGLGLYFHTLKYLLLIVGAACLLAIYPILDNIQADKTVEAYEFRTANVSAADTITRNCTREYDVTNYILATALGNHCAKDLRYTNAFDCPAVCAYDPQRVNRPFCPVPGPAEVPALLAASNCTSRPPCKVPPTATEEQITDTYGELQFTEWCDCCHLELDDAKLGDIPTVSIWLWCVAFTVIFLAWRSLLAKMQNGVSAAINRGSVTAADYAVLVSNVGGISNIKEVLVDYAAHYGEVLAAFPLLAVGDVLTQCDAITDKRLRLHEIDELRRSTEAQSGCCGCCRRYHGEPLGGVCGHLCGGCGGIETRAWYWVYKRFICRLRSPEAAKVSAEKAVRRLEEKNEALERAELKPTGLAIVVFNYEQHAKNLLRDHNRLPALASSLFTYDFLRRFHQLTRGVFSRAPRLRVPNGHGRDAQRFITVERAPEPSDMWWGNFQAFGWQKYARYGAGWAIWVVLLAASASLQYGLTRLAETERTERITLTRFEATEEQEKTNPDDTNVVDDAFESLVSSTKLRIFTILQGVVVAIVNIFVASGLKKAAEYERLVTSSKMISSAAAKLTLFFLINSFIIPIVVVSSLSESEDVWYTRGGFVETAFYIQVINAFLPDVIDLLDPLRLVRFRVFSHFARSQPFLNWCYAPPDFDLAQRFAGSVKTLGLSVLYAPILPISPIIGFIGLAFSYITDRYLALRICQAPRDFDIEALEFVGDIVSLLPLGQLLLIFLLYYRDAESVTRVPYAVGLMIYLLWVVLPIKQKLGIAKYDVQEDGGTRCRSFAESFGRQTLQPVAARPKLGEQAEALDARNQAKITVGDVSFSSQFYCPDVPKLPNRTATHEAFREKIARNHALLPEIVEGNPEPLPRQRGDCGGTPAVNKPHDVFDEDDGDTTSGGGIAVYNPTGGPAPSAPTAAALDGVPPAQPYAMTQSSAAARPGFYPSPYGALPSAHTTQLGRPARPPPPPPAGGSSGSAYPSPFPARKPANGDNATHPYPSPGQGQLDGHNGLYVMPQPSAPPVANSAYPQVGPPDAYMHPPPPQVAQYPQPYGGATKYPSPF